MQIGTSVFDSYTRTLRRVFQAEIVDLQVKLARTQTFRASLIDPPLRQGTDIASVALQSRADCCGRE